MRVLFSTKDLPFPGLGVVLELLDSPGTRVLREDALRRLFFGIGYYLVELGLAFLFLLAHKRWLHSLNLNMIQNIQNKSLN
jgi:hypothetical protein